MTTSMPREQVQADARTPSHVRVTAHTMESTPSSPPSNHWDVLFILSEKESIRATMRINSQNPLGSLEWQTLNCCYADSTVQYWDLRVIPETRIGTIAQLIYGLGRDKYDVSNGGSCCRSWVLTVIGDLAAWGYIESSAKEKLLPNILFLYYTSHRPAEELQMVKGTFRPRLLTNAEYMIYNLPRGPALQFEVNNVKKQTWLKHWKDYTDSHGRTGRRNKEYNLYFVHTNNLLTPGYGSMSDSRNFATDPSYISASYLGSSNYPAPAQTHSRSVSSPIPSQSTYGQQATTYPDAGIPSSTSPTVPSSGGRKKAAPSYSTLRYATPMYSIPYAPANYSNRSVSDPVHPSSGYTYTPLSSPNPSHSRTSSTDADGPGKQPDPGHPPPR